MKKQIDPNLNNSDDDILKQLAGNAGVEKKNARTTIDPQLNLNIIEELNNSDYDENTADIPIHTHHDERQLHSNSEYHHSEHHHSEHHHSEHHHSEHHHSGHHHSHHSNSENNEKRKKKPLAILLKILLAIISIILIFAIIAASTFLVLQHKGKKDIQAVVTQDQEYEETISYNGKNYVYDNDVLVFAFIGVDKRDFEKANKSSYVGSADTDIVIAIDTNDGKADIIAIPRDTMVDVDIYNKNDQFLRTENMQLCLSYGYGLGGEQSCRNVTKAMSRILSVPVDKYFALDLDGIAKLNDAIGGVTLESQFDFREEYGQDIRVGQEIKLEGDMAELYVRGRSTKELNASLGRTKRQIQYIKAYADRLIPAIKEDFSTISDLYYISKEYSQTNITLENVAYIASMLLSKNVNNFETHTLKGKMIAEPVDKNNNDDVYAQYILDEDALKELTLKIFYDEVG